MISGIRNYLASLRASSRLGRAYRLRNKGLKNEALIVAREGLAILGGSFITRQNPFVCSALIFLTTLVEELSSELNQPGASMNDLNDTLEFIKELPASSSTDTQNLKAWVPYLQEKTGRKSHE